MGRQSSAGQRRVRVVVQFFVVEAGQFLPGGGVSPLAGQVVAAGLGEGAGRGTQPLAVGGHYEAQRGLIDARRAGVHFANQVVNVIVQTAFRVIHGNGYRVNLSVGHYRLDAALAGVLAQGGASMA